jgi:surfeit locus 1 family protein
MSANRSLSLKITLALAIIGATTLFNALGVWQLERRIWKQELIARTDKAIHADAVMAPGSAEWAALKSSDAYRRVTIRGTFLNDLETPVQAVTDYGAGYWILTPLKSADGFIVLINRGFVPSDKKDPAMHQQGQITGETQVTGLLRMTEPRGRILRTNDPGAGRWYSRDVAAIAASHGLSGIAPYFIDADGTPSKGGLPIGGLTVIAFPNNHLIYAITWFSLALLSLIFGTLILRRK